MQIVSFVILHYKDINITDLCIQSILRMEKQEQIQIVLVDNDVNDSEESRKRLKERYKNISNLHVIQIEENSGFSYANNKGYAYARNVLQSAYIIVANNDIEFLQKDFVSLLKEVDQDAYVVGPDVIKQATGEHQNPLDTGIRGIKEATGTIKRNIFALKYYNILYPLLYWNFKRLEKNMGSRSTLNKDFYQKKQKDIVLFGACLIFMPLFVEKEEWAFTPETRFYYEEYILACRCQRNGYIMKYDPILKVHHETGGATKKTYISEKKRLQFVMEQTVASCEIYVNFMTEK